VIAAMVRDEDLRRKSTEPALIITLIHGTFAREAEMGPPRFYSSYITRNRLR
jgi:hypothetical protein